MSAKRTSLSIHESLLDEVLGKLAEWHYGSFSEYVADLVRRDLEARAKLKLMQGSIIGEQPADYGKRPA